MAHINTSYIYIQVHLIKTIDVWVEAVHCINIANVLLYLCVYPKQCKVLEFDSKILVELRHYTACCSTMVCTITGLSLLIVYMSKLITTQQSSFQRRSRTITLRDIKRML